MVSGHVMRTQVSGPNRDQWKGTRESEQWTVIIKGSEIMYSNVCDVSGRPIRTGRLTQGQDTLCQTNIIKNTVLYSAPTYTCPQSGNPHIEKRYVIILLDQW